jgi:uncharacterized protein (TIGR02145 family)
MFQVSPAQEELLEVEGGIKIGNMNSGTPEPGTIRFNGTSFEGWNGLTWVTLGQFKLTGTVTDYDGNIYNTIQVGAQEWMAENLRVTHYNDGSTMQIHVGTFIINFGSPGSLYYPNDASSNAPAYGALYDFECIETNKLCPSGWHVPDNSEWQLLQDAVGGSAIAGGKLKEIGTIHWESPNVGACNDIGFTARGAGLRDVNTGDLIEFKKICHWWSTTLSTGNPFVWFVENGEAGLANTSTPSKDWGFSVRCVKN